jgi:carbonic anhydrase
MQKLVAGIHHFQSNIFKSERAFFEQMAEGQTPETLFITCSDSRINPNLLTNTAPGELFILRNAGNIIPPWGPANGGESATIEYAVRVLKVEDIIVCGHSHCGAMQGLLNPESLEALPSVKQWLDHATETRRIVRENYAHLDTEALSTVAIQENVLAQLENLRTHPSVAERVAEGALHLHGWVYKIESGEVFTYDSDSEQFISITTVDSASTIPAPRRAVLPSI